MGNKDGMVACAKNHNMDGNVHHKLEHVLHLARGEDGSQTRSHIFPLFTLGAAHILVEKSVQVSSHSRHLGRVLVLRVDKVVEGRYLDALHELHIVDHQHRLAEHEPAEEPLVLELVGHVDDVLGKVLLLLEDVHRPVRKVTRFEGYPCLFPLVKVLGDHSVEEKEEDK